MEELNLRAPAKLNLHLEVLKKRQDGFHDISSLFTLIDLYDFISFKKEKRDIDLIESKPIKNNIVYKAANLLKEAYSVKQGVRIELIKSIPEQKGLGGGSSDAASTLIGLSKFWNLNPSKDDLMEIALKLGSDVPFFMYGKTAWAKGRGEILTEYPYKGRYFLILFPDTKISTEYAFQEAEINLNSAITKENFTTNRAFNSFEDWSRKTFSEIDKAFTSLENIGIPRLSGTGSTIFVEFSNLEDAKSAQLKNTNLVLTKTLERSPLMQIIE